MPPRHCATKPSGKPRGKADTSPSAAAGPHAGQASIRKAYEVLGVKGFYASHGARYTNPHEAQIFAAIAQLLDAVPATAWLGLQDLPPEVAAAFGGDSQCVGDTAADAEGSDEEEGAPDANGDPGGVGAPTACGGGGGGGSERHRTRPTHASASASAADFTPPPPPSAEAAAATAAAVTSGLAPPVPLRVLDLAAGSGEATAAVQDWNASHGMPCAAMPIASATGNGGGGGSAGRAAASQPQQRQATARRGKVGSSAAAQNVQPYALHVTACDPYTGAAYEARTGVAAQRWSFEDIADGLLADWEPPPCPPPRLLLPTQPSPSAPVTGGAVAMATAAAPPAATVPPRLDPAAAAAVLQSPPPPPFDLVICSFALHLAPPSRLHTTLAALSLASRWLAILAPHKRPPVAPSDGWDLAAARRVGRTHVRLYRSLVAAPREAVAAETG